MRGQNLWTIKGVGSGYLTKVEKPSKIIAAIEQLMEGGALMSSSIAMKTLKMLRSQKVVDQKTESYLSSHNLIIYRREK